MNPIKCFMLEPTDLCRIALRRFHSEHPDSSPCPGKYSYHNAETLIADSAPKDMLDPEPPHDDPRWPVTCSCGYTFPPTDNWQVFREHLFRRSDTSELCELRNPPVGAIWNCTWYPESMRRPDGLYLCCQTPGGTWTIDGKCSNCTRPNEPHECWVRHGVPPNLHVDKNGNTCAAGAGSILAGGWHGFLHNGHLVTA